ncbi:MAG TPA: ABC transporter substrate-binding protein [Candidatus Binataceae bacterium]|nr:ABC transporter substrate-binding protein [Candidatus Binataceae bacterium]
MAAALAMCAACAHPHARRAPGFIQVDIETSPTALDPRYATDAISERIVELMYDPMVRLDAQGGFIGDLADKVERISPSEIVFHLRHGVRFSDGRELTARDVKYTFDFVADGRNRSPKAAGLKQLKSLDVLDDYTIKMTTNGPYAPALEMAMLGIVPDGSPTQANGLLTPPGSGPFKLRELERDDRVVLERSGSAPANAIEGIVFKVVPDPTVRALELVEGICDLAPNNIQSDLLPYLRAQPGLEVVTSSGTTYWYLTFNFHDAALRDLRVRQAIAYAIDRKEIIHSYLRSTARIASGLLTPENWAYRGDVTTYPYDPERARQLLEGAGFNDRHQLVLAYKCAPEGMRMGEIMQAMLRRVGIEVSIRSNEWATFYDDMQRGNFDIAAMPWIGIRDPHHYFMVFDSAMTPPHGLNRGHYSNPEMDRLVEAGDATIDKAARKQIYAQVQGLAADDLPYVSLWWQDNVVVMNRAVANFRPLPNGSWLPLADLTLAP